MTIVELENVSKSYGDKNVLNNLSFKIEEGTFNVIMGASMKVLPVRTLFSSEHCPLTL